MIGVVVLSWDAGARLLEYVEINGGAGGSLVALTVSADSGELISQELAGRPLPWSADLEADGEDALLEASQGVHLERCSVKAKGSPANPGFTFRSRDSGRVYEVPASKTGISDKQSADMVQDKLEYLYAAELTPPGCWLGCDGGVDSYLRSRRAAASRRVPNTKFVNPYTFVPFPEHVSRREPAGHHLLGKGRFPGRSR